MTIFLHDRIEPPRRPASPAEPAIFPATSWRARLAAWLRQLATEISPPLAIAVTRGVLLQFTPTGTNLGRPIYTVTSLRGQFYMGTIEWSNQWHRAKFHAAPEAVFDQQCVAEIYAQLREMR